MAAITMYDSIYPGNLPGGAAAYAGYVNGNWPTYNTLVGKYVNSGAKLLSIDVFGNGTAHCLDVENGDATNANILPWFRRMRSAGIPVPVIYTSASNVQAVLNLMLGAGYGRQEFLVWSAHYTNTAHICAPGVCGYPAVDATQWTDAGPGSCDVSEVASYFFPWTLGEVTPTPPTPTAAPSLEDDVQIPPQAANAPAAPVGMSFNGAPYSTIGFCADPGVIGGGTVTVRCAFHMVGGGWSVATANLNPTATKAVVNVPANCDGVSFTREDNLNITLVPNFA